MGDQHDRVITQMFAPLKPVDAPDKTTTKMPRLLSDHEIKQLPRQYYRPVNTRDFHRNEPPCACAKEYKKCQHLVVLPCGCRMHKKCGDTWLNVKASCPYCLKNF